MRRCPTLLLTVVLLTWYWTPTIDAVIPRCGVAFPLRVSNRTHLAVSCGWVHWFTPEPDGFWSTQVSLRPPQVSWLFLSDQWAEVLADPRTWAHDDPAAQEWRGQQEWIKERDERRAWTFPRWHH